MVAWAAWTTPAHCKSGRATNLLAGRCVVAMRGAGGVVLGLDGALEEVRELPAQAFGAGWDDVSAARRPGLALES